MKAQTRHAFRLEQPGNGAVGAAFRKREHPLSIMKMPGQAAAGAVETSGPGGGRTPRHLRFKVNRVGSACVFISDPP